MTPAEFLRALTREPVSTPDDRFAFASVGNMVVASWTDASGRTSVAAYTNTSRCRHLWTGTPDAVESCRQAFAAEGLHIERPTPTPTPREGEDILDLFAAHDGE